jgi:hypothetical protein
MNDIPFSPGGLIPSAGPESDLIPVLLKSGEVIGVPHLVRAWLASGLSLEEWLQRRDRGGTDDDAS